MKKQNPNLIKLIEELKIASNKHNAKIWKKIAELLEKPSRKNRSVNISKIDKYVKEDEIALIPGKLLGNGQLTKKITIACFKASEKAKEKVKPITILELIKKNPKGTKVRIII